MSTDGKIKAPTRDNHRPFKVYCLPVEPFARPVEPFARPVEPFARPVEPFARPEHSLHPPSMMLPTIPFTGPQYQQQTRQFQPQQQFMYTQLLQMSPQPQQFISGQLNQTSLQDQLVMSNQLVQASPQDQHMSSQLGQTSPQQMSSHQAPTSSQAQYLMSSQLIQTSPQVQHLLYSQVAQNSLQLCRGSVNLKNIQQTVQNITVDLDSANFVYDPLAIGDSGSAHLRPDILNTSESLIEQREHDLNIPSVAGNPSINLDQNVFPTSVSASKTFDALMPEQESTNLMLETLLTTTNSCFTRNVVTPSAINSTSIGNDSFFYSPSFSCQDMPSTSQFYNFPVLSSGVVVPGPTTTSMIQTSQLPVKQERENVNIPAIGNTHISSASLWGNQANEHFFRDNFRATTGSFLESSPSATTVPLVNGNMGDTPAISSGPRAPKRSFSQSSLGPAARRTVSECSTSSGNVSLDENVIVSPNNESSNSGNSSEAVDRDPSYLEKRRKNNESAKKSRDARRKKEETLAIMVLELEQQNYIYNQQVQDLERQNATFRQNLEMLDNLYQQQQGRP